MKTRKFLNVVMQNYGRNGSFYTVSRIKPEEQQNRGSVWSGHYLVPPWMESFSPTPPGRLSFERSNPDEKRVDFLPFYERGSGGDSASKILCVDAAGRTVLHDMDDGSLQPIPCLNSPKRSRPICFSAINPQDPDPERAHVFYVLGRFPSSYDPFNFEALMYRDPSNGGIKAKGWHWHGLPPPPAYADNCIVNSHALVDIDGDSVLVVSSGEESLGTYCFNTASHEWFKAGSWRLPFFDRAAHVPELDNLSFGIVNNEPYHFCAMDISGRLLSKRGRPPMVYRWPHLDRLPEDWMLLDCSFVYLGAGRFCITTKVFEFGVDQRTGYSTEMGAVMSGVEVVRKKRIFF